MTDGLLDGAVDKVADRAPVDWDAIERAANSEDERKWLQCLRLLADISGVHEAYGDGDLSQDETRLVEPAADVARAAATEMWGRYRLIVKVGEGGFGGVYRAWDPQLEREVAIKILHPRIGDARLKESLLREGRALARVRHPNVVSVLGVESHDDRVGLVMEFVHGQTLEDTLKDQGPMAERDAALVGADVCRALAAVHAAGFVHRDVKARNVMRDSDGRVVLMDFGAGQQADQLKLRRTSIIGTPIYMAPEVLAGEPATICSDVYSTGVLLYRLVTGEYPVSGATIDEIRSAHMQGRRVPLKERRPELRAAFVRVIERSLASDPSKRYQEATALLEALQALTRSLGLAARGAMALTGAALAVSVVLFSGLATTGAFNRTLGRTAPFDADSWSTIFDVGWRSLLTPMLYISVMAMMIWIAGFVVRLLRLVPWIDRSSVTIERRARAVAGRLDVNDPISFAAAIVTLASLAIVAIVWAFAPLLDAVTVATISDQPASRLGPLAPGHPGYLYRICLEGLMLLLGGAMVRAWRLRADLSKRRRAVALLAIPFLLVVLMAQVPYRLLWQSNAPRVVVDGERCYVLGEAGTEALVFCPDRTPPRNRVVDVQTPGFRRLGVVENIFSPADTGR